MHIILLTRVNKRSIIFSRKEARMVVKKVIKALEKDGWIFVSQKGSHMKYKKGDKTCIIPNHHGDIPKGTLSNIAKSTGIKL